MNSGCPLSPGKWLGKIPWLARLDAACAPRTDGHGVRTLIIPGGNRVQLVEQRGPC